MTFSNANKGKKLHLSDLRHDRHVIAVVFAIAQCAMGAAGPKEDLDGADSEATAGLKRQIRQKSALLGVSHV